MIWGPSVTAYCLAFATLLGSFGASAADEPTREVCFSQGEMRELEVNKTVVPSVAAVRTARNVAGGGKVVRAVLCRTEGAYAYRISVLRRDGRVVRITVDGRTGKVEGNR